MESNRHKAMVTLSSDHAGINRELNRLERELLRVLARLDDARKVRDYVRAMRVCSIEVAGSIVADGRTWMERFARKSG